MESSRARLQPGKTSSTWFRRARSIAASPSRVSQFASGPLATSTSRVVRSPGDGLPGRDPTPFAADFRARDHLPPIPPEMCGPVSTPGPGRRCPFDIDRDPRDSSFDSGPGSTRGTPGRATRYPLGTTRKPHGPAGRFSPGRFFAGHQDGLFRTGRRSRATRPGRAVERAGCPTIRAIVSFDHGGWAQARKATFEHHRLDRRGRSDLAVPLHPGFYRALAGSIPRRVLRRPDPGPAGLRPFTSGDPSPHSPATTPTRRHSPDRRHPSIGQLCRHHDRRTGRPAGLQGTPRSLGL